MTTDKWENERAVLRKVQIHFVFRQEVITRIRHDAVDEDINPSDIVRKIVGLPYKKIQRARIGLSFNPLELEYLAKRYNLAEINEKMIKQAVMEETNQYYYQQRNS